MYELSPLTYTHSFRPQISEPYKSIGLIWASNIFKNIGAEKSPSFHSVLNMSVTPFLALLAISFRAFENVILVVRKRPKYL